MAFSTLLRTSVNLCRVNPGIRTMKFGQMSTAALRLNLTQDKVNPKLYDTTTAPLPQALRRFSTSPALMSAADHGKLWTIERYLSVALIPILPLAVKFPNILFDVVTAVSCVMHLHWGMEAVVIDYVRPVIFGSIIPKIGVGLVYVFSVFLLVGLLNLTFRGQGIGNSINTLWSM